MRILWPFATHLIIIIFGYISLNSQHIMTFIPSISIDAANKLSEFLIK